MKQTKLLIFDVDGTLLDSVRFNCENINLTLKELGYTSRVSEAKVRSHLGCTAEDFYTGVLEDECVEQWQEIRTCTRKRTQEMMRCHGRPFDGVSDTFKKLKEKGMTLVLYSNCSRPYLETAVEVTGIEPYIDYAECVKDNGLTKIELIHKILGKYPGKKAAIVGDRSHDLEAAVANQLPCIGAMYGFGQKEMTNAPYKIYNMKELVQLFDK